MTLHDVALKDAALKDAAMDGSKDAALKVSDWLEYYTPSTPAVKSGEQAAPGTLDVLDQMYAYYG